MVTYSVVNSHRLAYCSDICDVGSNEGQYKVQHRCLTVIFNQNTYIIIKMYVLDIVNTLSKNMCCANST